MKLSQAAVRRPVATTMVFLVVTLLGAYSFTRLQVDLFPELDFPSISVVATYSGVSPEEMETLVTEPIESAVARVEGIDKIESFSSEGRSRVALRFEWGTGLETAVNDVRAAVERIRPQLPEDMDPPAIYKFDLSNFPIMNMALRAPGMDEGQLQRFAEDIVKPRLERIPGVASADVSGARRREIHVELDPERLASLGVGPSEVVGSLRGENVTVPAGKVASGRENVLFRAMGEFESLQEVRRANLRPNDPRDLHVSDVSNVRDTYEDWSNIVRIDGERGVSLRISKSPGANTVEVADRLYEEIEAFNGDYGSEASLSAIVDSSTFIRRSIDDVQSSVLIGALLALVVLFIFLRNLGSTLVIGVAIPISIIATFGLMYAFDLTLNLITFGGIALGVGMLVDNAIVILENIFRRREEGDDKETAAVEGSREVGGAIVASTLTTLMVFVPVVFLGGFTAVFFQQMAVVVASALICSLLIALTLVPMLASVVLMRVDSTDKPSIVGRAFQALDNAYAGSVRAVIRFPVVVVIVCIAALGYAWTFTEDIGAELLPENDESEVRIFAEYPVGTRIEETEAAVREIEAIVQEEVPELQNMLSTVGTPGFWSTSGEESASLRLNLVPPDQRERSSEEIANALTPKLMTAIPEMRIFSRAGGGLWIFNFIRGGDARVRVEVRGYELDTADDLARQVTGVVTSVEGVTDARPSRLTGGREMRLYIDRTRAADLDLSTQAVAEAISTLTQGTIAGYYRERGDEFPIRVRLAEKQLESVESVLSTPLAVSGSRTLQVQDMVRQDQGQTPKAIERLNQERIVTVTGGIDGSRDLASINADIEEKLAEINVPEGFNVRVAGEGEEQDDSFAALMTGLLLSLVLVYMVMAGQFESFLQPIVVMLAVPFAGIGVIFTLLWTETTINMNSFLGIIVLVGVVVNNAIVLIDYINMMRRERGFDLRDAIVESSRRRLRPILMTTATTILALLPVAISSGSGSEGQAPLARVVVGGLLASTIITLFLVPALYLWFAQLQAFVSRIWARISRERPSKGVAAAE